LISLNLLKLRSAVLLIAVTGKLSLEWPHAAFLWASAVIFQEGQRRQFAYTFQFGDDAMQTAFTKRFTLSSRKEIASFYSNSNKKLASLAAVARILR